MRLSEALEILQSDPGGEAASFRISLVCSFTPLYARTFLGARLQLALKRRVEVQTGIYGDLLGSLRELAGTHVDAAAVLLEWTDLDARLGLRGLGGWRLTDFTELVDSVRLRTAQIKEALNTIGAGCRLVVCLPTLPLPPLDPASPGWKAGALELHLHGCVAALAAGLHDANIVSPEWLDKLSPLPGRFDVKSEMLHGFPYMLSHADAVCESVASLVHPPASKKGLITDLDNTLWKGIVGEVGVDGISWDLDSRSHLHAVYQELLDSLAASGVLIAVASKNELPIVEEVFRARAPGLSSNHIFPFEVHWNPKSESVTRILNVWNVGAESLVFVDDNPAEVAEVRTAHPEMTCLTFPSDPQALWDFLVQLRTMFAKGPVTSEDRIRMSSIRGMAHARGQAPGIVGSPDVFLEQSDSELSLDFEKTARDPRVLELLNKTNQFNLNGHRYTEADVRAVVEDERGFLLKASYQDKFGPLGKIAVMMGRANETTIEVEAWVMSCRAFSRRIEYQCLNQLFRKFGAAEARFRFIPTERNKPMQQFLSSVVGSQMQPPHVSRKHFDDTCPALFHRVLENANG